MSTATGYLSGTLHLSRGWSVQGTRETFATVSVTDLAEGRTLLGRFGVPGLTLAVVGI